jgi:hypothetical protein
MSDLTPDEESPPREGQAPDDEQLVEHLRELTARVDPVPEKLLATGRGSYAWRTVDVELAALAYDSALADDEAAAARSGGDARLLTFQTPELTIEVEVTVSGSQRLVAGQLVPGSPAVVEISHGGGTDVITADRLGRFAAGPITPGPVSLRCRRAGPPAGAVKTEWVRI